MLLAGLKSLVTLWDRETLFFLLGKETSAGNKLFDFPMCHALSYKMLLQICSFFLLFHLWGIAWSMASPSLSNYRNFVEFFDRTEHNSRPYYQACASYVASDKQTVLIMKNLSLIPGPSTLTLCSLIDKESLVKVTYSNSFWNCANSRRSKIASYSLDKTLNFDAYMRNPHQCSVAIAVVILYPVTWP